MKNIGKVVRAVFASVWDDDLTIRTPAMLNTETGEVFDIATADVSGIGICTGEYVVMDGREYPVMERDGRYYADAFTRPSAE